MSTVMLRWSSSKQTLKQFPAQFYCQATWQCKLQPERRQHAPYPHYTPPHQRLTHMPACLPVCVCVHIPESKWAWLNAGCWLQAASIDNAEMLLICATLFCTEAKLLNRLCIMQVLPTYTPPSLSPCFLPCPALSSRGNGNTHTQHAWKMQCKF